MDNYPPGLRPDNREVARQFWDGLVAQQNNLTDRKTELFRQILKRNMDIEEEMANMKQAVEQAQSEVMMWKKAYIQDQQEGRDAKDAEMKLRKQLADLEASKDRDPVVLALIDGDGYIFKDELLQRGHEGGREAAQKLNENIMAQVGNGDQGGPRVQLWTYIFFNLKGLQQTLARLNICPSATFEAFVMGFNQSNPRFSIHDVHSGKEAADAKIKAYLHTWSRFPQTLKIYFGGGHDNGYHPTLSELQSEGLLDKIIILQGYEQVAAEIRSLHIPTFKIENLFRLEKLVSKGPPVSPRPTLGLLPPVGGSPKAWYTGAVVTTRAQTLPLRPATSTSASASSNNKPRHLTPNVDLHKLNPPPCNTWYLDNKCNKVDCKYGHDYILEPHHCEILKENAKKSPCPAVNLESPCPWGESCRLGHKCPDGPNCYRRKIGTCWFKAKSMHT